MSTSSTRGVALVSALLIVGVLGALLLARTTVQALHIAAVDAQRRGLRAIADAETGIAWAIAEAQYRGDALGVDGESWTLPEPLDGQAWVVTEPTGLRILVRVGVRGATVEREVLVHPL